MVWYMGTVHLVVKLGMDGEILILISTYAGMDKFTYVAVVPLKVDSDI